MELDKELQIALEGDDDIAVLEVMTKQFELMNEMGISYSQTDQYRIKRLLKRIEASVA